MKAYRALPEGYREVRKIDLQNDRKTALTVNLIAAAVFVAFFAAGCFIVPVRTFFDMEPIGSYFIRFGVTFAAFIAYIVLHELTHALAMKSVGGGKVLFGFTGLYAFAGSREDWFDKSSYRLIALAPLVVWGVLFAAAAVFAPEEWFWTFWFLESGNVAGAAGDVYVTAVLWNEPETILVQDTGVDMTVYGPERETAEEADGNGTQGD